MWLLCEPKGPGRWLLCEPKGPGYQQVHDCCVNPKDQEITRRVIVAESVCENGCRAHTTFPFCWRTISGKSWRRCFQVAKQWLLCELKGPGDHQAGDCCVKPKDQEISRWVIVVWTQRTRKSPGRWLLCEPKGPGDHQVVDCCVNSKEQEITRRVSAMWTRRTRRSPGGWLLCEHKGPGDHQTGDCCVNPKDQEITRWVIVVWTQRTRRHQAGDCCVNPKDQEITRRVIVVWTQRTRRSPGGWLLQNLCLWKWLQSPHNLSFLLEDHFRKVVKEMFPDSETAKMLSWGQPIWDVNCMEVLYLGIL